MGQSTLFCVEDHFYEHKHAFLWALTHLVNEGDELHVVTVLPLSAYSASPRGKSSSASPLNSLLLPAPLRSQFLSSWPSSLPLLFRLVPSGKGAGKAS